MSDEIGRLPRCPVQGCRHYLPAGRTMCTRCGPCVPITIGLALEDMATTWRAARGEEMELRPFYAWVYERLFALAVAEAGRIRAFRGHPEEAQQDRYWRYDMNPKTWVVEIYSPSDERRRSRSPAAR